LGFFSKGQQESAKTVFEKEVKPSLQPKNGKVHVIMINSFSKWINQIFGCDDKYTTQIDSILTAIQNEGYEIVDVKLNSIQNQGITGSMEGFHTLILYK